MKKYLWLLITLIIMITTIFIGCFDSGVTTDRNLNNLIFESDVVALKNYSVNIIQDEEEIIRVDVEFLFSNIVPRDIKVKVTAEFYDKNNNLLGIGPRREIELLRGYTETTIFPANIISYDKEDAAKVDYVKLTAVEF